MKDYAAVLLALAVAGAFYRVIHEWLDDLLYHEHLQGIDYLYPTLSEVRRLFWE